MSDHSTKPCCHAPTNTGRGSNFVTNPQASKMPVSGKTGYLICFQPRDTSLLKKPLPTDKPQTGYSMWPASSLVSPASHIPPCPYFSYIIDSYVKIQVDKERQAKTQIRKGTEYDTKQSDLDS